jgi:hypothetical protein
MFTALLALEDAARRVGLRINQEITSQNEKQSENVTICDFKFEVVQILYQLQQRY